MKRIIPISLIVSASIFLTACSIPGISKAPSATNTTAANEETTAKAQPTAEAEKSELNIQGSVLDLLKNVTAGTALKCTFDTTKDGTNVKGTTYVKDKLIRSDVDINNSEKLTIKSSSVIKDNWVYTWMSNNKQGVKMDMSKFMKDGKLEENSLTQEGIKEAFQSQENMNYKCSPTTVDSSMFEVPADINFVDVSAMIDAFKNMDPDKLKIPFKLPENN